VEGEEGFAALRLPADDADRGVRPQLIDQPTLLLGAVVQLVRASDREHAHVALCATRRALPLLAAACACGRSKTSKKSFSSSCVASRCAAAASRSAAIVVSTR